MSSNKKSTVIKYALKYDDGRGYVDWDDRGGPMCSGMDSPVETIDRARMYDDPDYAAKMCFTGVHIVKVLVQEL